jgi:hypothetical protein
LATAEELLELVDQLRPERGWGPESPGIPVHAAVADKRAPGQADADPDLTAAGIGEQRHDLGTIVEGASDSPVK